MVTNEYKSGIRSDRNAYIRGAIFLVSAYAKLVSRGWCSQSPGLWIMHAIFARSKRNVRSCALACIDICIICTRERMYIGAIRIYAFWRVRRWNRTVIRMIYTRWTVGFETRQSTARVLLREASRRWIRLVVHVVYLRRWKRDTLRESRVNCHINCVLPYSRRDFLLGNCCVTFDNTFSKITSQRVRFMPQWKVLFIKISYIIYNIVILYNILEKFYNFNKIYWISKEY